MIFPPMSLNTAYFVYTIMLLTGIQIVATLAAPDQIPIWFLALGLSVNLSIRKLASHRTHGPSEFLIVLVGAMYGFLVGFFRFNGNWLTWLILIALAVVSLYLIHLMASWLANHSLSQHATIILPVTIITYYLVYSFVTWDFLLSIPWAIVRVICGLAIPYLMNYAILNLGPQLTYRLVTKLPISNPQQAFRLQLGMLFLYSCILNGMLIFAVHPHLTDLFKLLLAGLISIIGVMALFSISQTKH